MYQNTTETQRSFAQQNSIWFTWNTQSNSIWSAIGLNAKFTCPPSSMGRLHTLCWCCCCCRWCSSLFRVGVPYSTQLPIVCCSRFVDSLLSMMIIDHHFVGCSIWERNDVATTRELNGNKIADAFRTIHNECLWLMQLLLPSGNHLIRRVQNGTYHCLWIGKMGFVC